jgi:hypothetical protein
MSQKEKRMATLHILATGIDSSGKTAFCTHRMVILPLIPKILITVSLCVRRIYYPKA